MADKLTIKEAARVAGVSRQAVHDAVRRGKLVAEWGVVEREVILIDADVLRRWIQARRVPGRRLSEHLKAGDNP